MGKWACRIVTCIIVRKISRLKHLSVGVRESRSLVSLKEVLASKTVSLVEVMIVLDRVVTFSRVWGCRELLISIKRQVGGVGFICLCSFYLSRRDAVFNCLKFFV